MEADGERGTARFYSQYSTVFRGLRLRVSILAAFPGPLEKSFVCHPPAAGFTTQ
jgi:hypothetical protein